MSENLWCNAVFSGAQNTNPAVTPRIVDAWLKNYCSTKQCFFKKRRHYSNKRINTLYRNIKSNYTLQIYMKIKVVEKKLYSGFKPSQQEFHQRIK